MKAALFARLLRPFAIGRNWGVRAAAVLGLLTTAVGTPAGALTLEEAVRGALRTNPDVLISRDDVRIAEQETRQARAGYYPLLDLRGATGIENTSTPTTRLQSGTDPTLWRNEGGLTLRQNLFDGFGTQGDIDRARAREGAAGERVKVSANTVGLAAVEAYLEVIRNRELVRLGEEHVASHEDIVGRARARAGVGSDPQAAVPAAGVGRGDATELPRSSARLAGVIAALQQQRGRLRDAEATFYRVIGMRPGVLAPVAPLGNVLPKDEMEAFGRALERSPGIRAANKDIEAASGELQQADARFWPRVDLELGANRNKNVDGVMGMNNDNSALLVMRYNLYAGGADVARRRASLERIARARNSLVQTRRNLEQETQLAWNALTTALDRIPVLREQVRQSSLARAAYREQFDIGRKTITDLLDAEVDHFTGTTNLVTGELTARFGEFRLLAATYSLFQVLGVADPDVEGRETPSEAR